MPQIRMKVGGMEYAINSDDDEAYVKSIGEKLDSRLNELARKNPFLSTTMVAVLAALEAYDETKKAQIEIEKLRMEIKQLLEENAMSKMTVAMANRRLEEVLGKLNSGEEEYQDNRQAPTPNKIDPPDIIEPVDMFDDIYIEEDDNGEKEYNITEDESGQYGIF